MEPTPPTWPERFMSALVPSDRAVALIILLAVFAAGVASGLKLAANREMGAMSREVARSAAEVQVPQRSGPTLSQRLDTIDERLQAIERRLSP